MDQPWKGRLFLYEWKNCTTLAELGVGEGALPAFSLAFRCCVLFRDPHVKTQPLIHTFVVTGSGRTLHKGGNPSTLRGNPQLKRKSSWNLFLRALNTYFNCQRPDKSFAVVHCLTFVSHTEQNRPCYLAFKCSAGRAALISLHRPVKFSAV